MAMFVRSESAYVIAQSLASAGYKAVSEALNSFGVDDWRFRDTANGINRMISPATFETVNIAAFFHWVFGE